MIVECRRVEALRNDGFGLEWDEARGMRMRVGEWYRGLNLNSVLECLGLNLVSRSCLPSSLLGRTL